MAKELNIPKEDVEHINRVFKQDAKAQVLEKGASGGLVKAKAIVVNQNKGFEFQSFSGKTLKHRKAKIGLDGKFVVVAVAGDKFDDIPLDQRKLVTWFETDFIN